MKNIKSKKLITIISIILLILLLNQNINKIAKIHTPPLFLKSKSHYGIALQFNASILSYYTITAFSHFDNDIKNDMNSIAWNPFNDNEILVLESKKVSFYKGIPVFRITGNRSGSFLGIFLTDESISRNTVTDVRHEWGHNIQQMILGPVNFGTCIGLPSWLEWSNRSYYNRPWEITADIFGGVISRKHNDSDISRGYWYLNISALFGNLSYLFLPGEYN